MYIKFLLIALIIFLVSLTRIFPHPPNFTPILALALFGGAYLPNKKTSFLIPISAMFLSDLILGFHSQIYGVYGCILILSFLGRTIQNKISIGNLAITGVIGSLIFFIITNFSVWLSGSIYPLTTTGLIECYTMAIPFFHNTLISTFVFLAILFTGYSFAEKKYQFLNKI
jgi:hypothetical protein|tara:strand:+ start:259 stop:768 length:510 start_codon:yes stop_codon:yes gene_type:complete